MSDPMIIVLYGPPGIGKTTLIRRLVLAGYPAYDLEDFSSTEERELALLLADNCFLGGADTQPKRIPGRVNVLLSLEEDQYRARRDARDAAQPQKLDQATQTVASWLDHPGIDVVLTADDEVETALIDLVTHPQIVVPPKPKKNLETWTAIVRDHSNAVNALMSWASFRLALAGKQHDQDKLNGPNERHNEQRHHWYHKDHSVDDPDLFDLIESAADTVATTLGRWRADPWNLYLWNPPTQTVPWWDAVYGRTVARLWGATDAPALFEHLPGRPDFDVHTKTVEDD